jgi:hypothetical protein
MIKLLYKLFAQRPPSQAQPEPSHYAADTENPSASAQFTDRINAGEPKGVAYAHGEENLEEEHRQFCESFCFKPGVRLMDFLKQEGITRMVDWLDWRSPYPEPKAIIRLALDMIQRGENFWDQAGICMFVTGARANRGEPAQESQDAISVLSQITGKPIKVYYHDQPGSDAPLMVKEFEP